MKNTIMIILLIVVIIVCIFFAKFVEFNHETSIVRQFNYYYQKFDKDNLTGLDIVTVINKAMNENQINEIAKDEKGYYNQDDNKSIIIYVDLTKNEDENDDFKVFRMEKIVNVGMDSFVELFGSVKFKCTKVNMHEDTGRIASMIFEAYNY